MAQPKINIKRTKSDFIIEAVSIISLAVAVFIIIYYQNEFPETIPIRYNAIGQPDLSGPKWILFILPVMGFITYAGMTFLARFPHKFNYPVEVDEKNVRPLYQIGVRIVSFLKMMICLLILYICYAQKLSLADGKSEVNIYIILMFIFIIAATPVYAVIKMKRISR